MHKHSHYFTMPLTFEETRDRIKQRMALQRKAMTFWRWWSWKREYHKGRLAEAQEILTMIDSGGADAL